MMHQLDHTRSLAANIHQHPAGSLKLGCLPSLGLHLIPQAVSLIRRRYPDINIEITTGHEMELVRKLRSREINIAFTFKPADIARACGTPTPLGLVVSDRRAAVC